MKLVLQWGIYVIEKDNALLLYRAQSKAYYVTEQ